MGGAADTPMMRQFLRIKASVPDAILLYLMGDIYEVFFEDAVQAAEILELTLTSRNKNDPDPIPMAGIPYHALETYLPRLVQAGRKVAIAEQRAPAPGQKTKLMERHIVRVVTPGVPWDSDGLDAREACYLAAIHVRGSHAPIGLAFLDTTTGDLRLTTVEDLGTACDELVRMEARELVAPRSVLDDPRIQALQIAGSTVDDAWFDAAAAVQTLCQTLDVSDLFGFGASPDDACVPAGGAVISYARQTARIGLSTYAASGSTPLAGKWCSTTRRVETSNCFVQCAARAARALCSGSSTAPVHQWVVGCCESGCCARSPIRSHSPSATMPSSLCSTR